MDDDLDTAMAFSTTATGLTNPGLTIVDQPRNFFDILPIEVCLYSRLSSLAFFLLFLVVVVVVYYCGMVTVLPRFTVY